MVKMAALLVPVAMVQQAAPAIEAQPAQPAVMALSLVGLLAAELPEEMMVISPIVIMSWVQLPSLRA
jgi:hypothetical protein